MTVVMLMSKGSDGIASFILQCQKKETKTIVLLFHIGARHFKVPQL